MKKKRILSRIATIGITAALFICQLPITASAAVTGSGTESNPYLVSTWTELQDKMKEGGYIQALTSVYGVVKRQKTKTDLGQLVVPKGKTVNLDLSDEILSRNYEGSIGYDNIDGRMILVEGNLSINSSSDTSFITNSDCSENGGGIYVANGGTLTLGDKIAMNNVNSEKNGGAIYVESGGKVILNGTSIYDNEARGYGGGIYLEDGAQLYLNSAAVGWCGADLGGGIYVSKDADFHMSGDVFITGSDPNGKTDNIYLASGAVIIVDGKLKTELADDFLEQLEIGVTAQDSKAVIAEASDNYNNGMIDEESANRFHSDTGERFVLHNGKLIKGLETFDYRNIENNRATYDGSDKTSVVKVVVNGKTLKKDADYTIEIEKKGNKVDKAIDAGEYSITIEGTGFYAGKATAPFMVYKKAVSVNGITAKDKVYDENTDAELDFSKAVISGIVNGDSISVKAKGTFDNADAGENKVVNLSDIEFVGIGAGNYTVDTSKSQSETTASITKGLPVVITDPKAAEDLIDNGDAKKLVTEGKYNGGSVKYAIGSDDSNAPLLSSFSAAVPEATKEGTYYVWYMVAGDDNHEDINPACITVTIAKGTEPVDPDDPTKPDNPDDPDDPTKPDNPDNPDDPTNPDNPDNPDDPTKPDNPDNPNDPTNPDKPIDPNNPTNPDNPANPDMPVNPANPSGNPVTPGDSKAPTVLDPAPAEHQAGDIVNDESTSASYKISSVAEGARTVVYRQCLLVDSTTAKIPATVTIDNKEYRVTEIAAGAFKGNKKLKKITIGKNIVKIGSKAFYKCKNLKTVIIKTTALTKKSVGASAFKGIHEKAKVKVPKKNLDSYKKILKTKGINGKNQKITK